MKGFVAKRLTFSEECLEMIRKYKKIGNFRSLSATVEEIIRRLEYARLFGTVGAFNIQFKRLDISLHADVNENKLRKFINDLDNEDNERTPYCECEKCQTLVNVVGRLNAFLNRPNLFSSSIEVKG